MRKLAYLVVALALVAVTALIVNDTPVEAEAAFDIDSKKVGVCHVPTRGHDSDFVLGNQDPAGAHSACAAAGGHAIFVGVKACEKGHKAAVVPGGSNAGGTCSSMAS